MNGYVNKQNCLAWDDANPHEVHQLAMHPQKVTVWCAFWAGGVIGPYFFENIGERYRSMVINFCWPKLNYMDVDDMWFQQDGATCHTIVPFQHRPALIGKPCTYILNDSIERVTRESSTSFVKFVGNVPYNVSYWSDVAIALTTQGNFRVPLLKGNITYNQLITMCPWENNLYALTLKGQIIMDLLEDCVAPMKVTQTLPRSSRFLQVSGMHIIYNISQPVGERVQDVKVRCRYCAVPNYMQLRMHQDYRLVVMEYLANGKNGFKLIQEHAKDVELGPGDLDAFTKYMQINQPITTALEGRIKLLK